MPSPLKAITADTIALMRSTILADIDIEKAFSQPGSWPAGMQNIDLEPVAKVLFPVLTPLRNRIPRKGANGSIQAYWKAFTGVNTGQIDLGLGDGNRGGVQTTGTADYFAIYKQLGLDGSVTRAAQLAAAGFVDLLSQEQTNVLWATMIGEEALDLAGNATLQLGRGNQPSAADSSTGGAIPFNTVVSVIVAPLSAAGYAAATIAGGVRGQVTRTNADGTSDTFGGGTGQPSVNRSITTANDASNAHSVATSTALIGGAYGYAWFWGTAGNERLGALTTINSLVITTAQGAGTQLASAIAADYSTNALVYDGVLTQTMKSGYGGYFYSMPTGTAGAGTGLTPDNVGGIVEFDTALQYFWDVSRLSPDNIWVSSQEARNVKRKVLTTGGTGAQRFIINGNQGGLMGGDAVATYNNPFSLNGSKVLNVRLHPNVPPGTVFFDTEQLPYPVSGVADVLVKRLRHDYLAEPWPATSRKYPFSVTFDGVLQNYFPPAFGVINNIGNA
jgi:hypothetical protein